MKHQYLKSTRRMFGKHFVRLLSIAAIFLVTVSLVSGLGDVVNNIYHSINTSYHEDNIHDFLIRSTTNNIADIKKVEDKLSELKDDLGIDRIEEYYSYDIPHPTNPKYSTRYIYFDKEKNDIDRLEIIEGRLPVGPDEVAVERVTKDFNNRHIGDVIDLPYGGLTVVGVVKNPTMIALSKEPSDYFTEEEPNYLNDVFYLDSSVYSYSIIAPTLEITLKNRDNLYAFDDNYKNVIDIAKSRIELVAKGFASEDVAILTLYECYSLYSLHEVSDKVGVLAISFIAFFLLIAALVVYSSMSRLLDEDRPSIATLKTLGYSNFAITSRYTLYVLLAGLTGATISIAPSAFVNRIILNAFSIQYAMKEVALPLVGGFYFILASVLIAITLILTFVKASKIAKQKPVELLTHKAPKIGKKVFLEYVKPIWSRLSFKYKSTVRNIFLFKSRLIMTLLSIIGSTMLVFASLSLLDKSFVLEGFSSVRIISIVLIIFSGALAALVIYNLTNINVSERTREIATLMVLGYRNNETTGYIYREIYILAVIGAIIGLPLGVVFVQAVFNYVYIGGVEDTNWWSFIITPIVTLIFAFIATLLLRRKIVKTDMNESLKVLE